MSNLMKKTPLSFIQPLSELHAVKLHINTLFRGSDNHMLWRRESDSVPRSLGSCRV